jgi:hypothetical protein
VSDEWFGCEDCIDLHNARSFGTGASEFDTDIGTGNRSARKDSENVTGKGIVVELVDFDTIDQNPDKFCPALG